MKHAWHPSSSSMSHQSGTNLQSLGSLIPHIRAVAKSRRRARMISARKGVTLSSVHQDCGGGRMSSHVEPRVMSMRSSRSTISLCSQNPRGLSACGGNRDLPNCMPSLLNMPATAEVPLRCMPRTMTAVLSSIQIKTLVRRGILARLSLPSSNDMQRSDRWQPLVHRSADDRVMVPIIDDGLKGPLLSESNEPDQSIAGDPPARPYVGEWRERGMLGQVPRSIMAVGAL